MAKNNNIIFYIIGIIVLIAVAVMLAKYTGLFVISEVDLTNTGIKTEYNINAGETLDKFTNFSIANNTISFKIGTTTKTIGSGQNVFFMFDDKDTTYPTFQDVPEGTHTVLKYQMFIVDNNQVNVQKWVKTYDVMIKTVYVNKTIANQTFYVTNTTYVDRNVTQYVNNTVEKKVVVEPTLEYTLNYFYNKYQVQIIGILAVGLIWFATRKKKK